MRLHIIIEVYTENHTVFTILKYRTGPDRGMSSNMYDLFDKVAGTFHDLLGGWEDRRNSPELGSSDKFLPLTSS